MRLTVETTVDDGPLDFNSIAEQMHRNEPLDLFGKTWVAVKMDMEPLRQTFETMRGPLYDAYGYRLIIELMPVIFSTEPEETAMSVTNAMNMTTAVFLINDKVRAVMGTYEADRPNGHPEGIFTAPRELFKTFNADVKVGDLCIVPSNTRHNFTVVKIVDVDVEIDFDSPKKAAWLVGTVDTAEYERLMGEESKAIKKINEARAFKRREELREALIGTADLKDMPIALEAPKSES